MFRTLQNLAQFWQTQTNSSDKHRHFIAKLIYPGSNHTLVKPGGREAVFTCTNTHLSHRASTYNLVRGRLEEAKEDVDKVLTLQKLELHQHPLHAAATATPQCIDVLRLLHQHTLCGLFARAIVTWLREGKKHEQSTLKTVSVLKQIGNKDLCLETRKQRSLLGNKDQTSMGRKTAFWEKLLTWVLKCKRSRDQFIFSQNLISKKMLPGPHCLGLHKLLQMSVY